MPIYSDEVALRLQSARALADGAVLYPPIPQCGTNASAVAWPLVPVAYLFSVFDFAFGWSFLRALPIGALLAAMGAALALLQRRGPNLASAFMLTAFVGVAGSSLVLMRMECFLTLQASGCIVAYLIATRESTASWRLAALVTILVTSLLSIYVHPQGLILVPAESLLIIALARGSRSVAVRGLAAVVGVVVIVSCVSVLHRLQFGCLEHPEIQQFLAGRTMFGAGQFGGYGRHLQPWLDRLRDYVTTFTYNTEYGAGYLPGVAAQTGTDGRVIARSNVLIRWFVIGNLGLAFAVTLAASFHACSTVLKATGGAVTRLGRLLETGSPYLAAAGLGHFAYLIYDVQGNFYRAHYFNLAFALITAFGLAPLPKWRGVFLLPIAAILAVMLVFSHGLNVRFFDARFGQGWHGPSLPLKTDWTATQANVDRLAHACGFADDQAGLLVDDLTFSAMKRHPHVVAVTYLMLGALLSHPPPASNLSEMRRFSTGLMVDCGTYTSFLGSAGEHDVERSGNVCCMNFGDPLH